MRILTSLVILVLAGGLVAACEEAPSGKSGQSGGVPSASTKSSTSAATTVSAKQKWVWPGNVKDTAKLVVDPMQIRKNYVVVFDGSGSMGYAECSGPKHRDKYAAGRDAVIAFSKLVPVDVNLGLVVFDRRGIQTRVELGVGNRAQFEQEIRSVQINGGTPLKSSIRLGYDMLTVQGQKQFGYGTYSLIIVTDGDPSSGENPTNIVNQIVDNTPVEVHTVGFCIGDNHPLNQRGRTFYASADSPEKLLDGLKSVLAETVDAGGDFTN